MPGLRIEHADCGLPPGRCCDYSVSTFGACSMQSRAVCEQIIGGVWTYLADCSGPCPPMPINDFAPTPY